MFSELLGSVVWCPSLIFKKSLAIETSDISSTLFSFLFPSDYFHYTYVTPFEIVPEFMDVLFWVFLFVCFVFFFLFSLYLLVWEVSINIF